LSFGGTPESDSFPPDALAVITVFLAEPWRGFHRRTRGPLHRRAGEGATDISPRTPSVVFTTCKPKPAGREQGNDSLALLTRTDSPSTHPRHASGGATDFLQASALFGHQQVLRPPGEEDARCVEPTSATQTNYVYPHLARSRLALATFAAGTPHGVFGSMRLTGGPDVSRRP
jgi:hypothetical protein